ncbi:MAG: hypothetical protein NZL87_06785, partial [Thermomicrobium sp.]|nr:hypothetical protein [Thermomicrobium sp.]
LGPLKDVLARIPSRFSTVRAFVRNFVPRSGSDFFAERMTARLVPSDVGVASSYLAHPFRAQDKVIHRANPAVTVSEGNHDAYWEGSIDLRGWWPFEVLHFPVRSAAQAVIKWQNWARHRYAGYDELLVGTATEYYARIVLDDAAAVRGVEEGWLVLDTRLREALRALRSSRERGREDKRGSTFIVSDSMLDFPAPTLADAAAFAKDITAGSSVDSAVKARKRVEMLEARLGMMECPLYRRLALYVGNARCRLRAVLGRA